MMRLPGFTAERAFAKSEGRYRLVPDTGDFKKNGIVLQRMKNEVVWQEYIAWHNGCAYACDERTDRCRLLYCVA